MKKSTYFILILLGLLGWLGYDNYRLRGNNPKTLDNYFNQIKSMKEKVDFLQNLVDNKCNK